MSHKRLGKERLLKFDFDPPMLVRYGVLIQGRGPVPDRQRSRAPLDTLLNVFVPVQVTMRAPSLR